MSESKEISENGDAASLAKQKLHDVADENFKNFGVRFMNIDEYRKLISRNKECSRKETFRSRHGVIWSLCCM